jgi:hypothetical protein
MVAHTGESAVVKEGLPMMLSSVGTETRNAFALILHDSEQPWTMVMKGDGWKPAGAVQNNNHGGNFARPDAILVSSGYLRAGRNLTRPTSQNCLMEMNLCN